MMLTDPFIIEYYLADEGIASQGQTDSISRRKNLGPADRRVDHYLQEIYKLSLLPVVGNGATWGNQKNNSKNFSMITKPLNS